ncbi:hypothetical protein BHM03_00057929 [Ensete ventricosum]|nr:hypothetical protein BHM03_00057929 [Ensete ventricosum]
MYRVDAVGNSSGVRRELAEGIESLPRWRKGVRQKKIETHQKIIGGSRKACWEFAEGIEKLVRNTPGDHRKKTKRLIARMPEATGLAGTGRLNRPYRGILVLSTVDPPRTSCERNYNSYDTGLSCLNLSFYLRLESFDEGS